MPLNKSYFKNSVNINIIDKDLVGRRDLFLAIKTLDEEACVNIEYISQFGLFPSIKNLQ